MTYDGAVARRVEIAGMSTLEFGDPDRPVDLVFLHANGFHAHLYAALLEPLAQGLRILAPDLRGFGRTTLPADPAQLRSWNTFRDDLLALLDAVEARDVVLAGHSMGATASLLAAAEAPDRVRAVVLIEPVIMPSTFYVAMNFEPTRRAVAARFPLSRDALRRRARFNDRDAAFAAYLGRGAFRTWPDDTLRAYVDEGTMVDTWVTVGSCAQIGKKVHLSGGVGIGGVLEPLQAGPVIIEDNCFIGARSEVVEGCIVREGAVLGMGVFIGKSTKIVDRATGEVFYGEVPPYSVVVAGTMPGKPLPNGEPGPNLYCAVIVKTVDEKTRSKTAINELLRD